MQFIRKLKVCKDLSIKVFFNKLNINTENLFLRVSKTIDFSLNEIFIWVLKTYWQPFRHCLKSTPKTKSTILLRKLIRDSIENQMTTKWQKNFKNWFNWKDVSSEEWYDKYIKNYIKLNISIISETKTDIEYLLVDVFHQ
jgi:hypothetical protein